MAGAKLVLDVAVVLGAGIDILDLERDRRSGRDLRARLVGEHAREDAHPVRFLPLSDIARRTWTALIETGLDLGLGDRDAGRTAIDHAADRRPLAFAPGGDAEEMAETVERHGFF